MQMKPDVQPLATIDYQGVAWPVAWTRTYGKGRVFHTTLGHRDFGPDKDDPLRNPNVTKLIIQGVDWVAAGRKSPKSPDRFKPSRTSSPSIQPKAQRDRNR